ncbi:MAG: hypothetical protein KBS59_02905, partial [Clostridiales bacterium]|nr:hypothetical protein [Clostridiales bacterium]
FEILSADVERENAGEETVITNTSERIMRIKLTVPDFKALMSLSMSESATSGMMNSEIIEQFAADGMIEKHIISKEITVKLIRNDGWTLPISSSENSELYNALMLSSFASWLIG